MGIPLLDNRDLLITGLDREYSTARACWFAAFFCSPLRGLSLLLPLNLLLRLLLASNCPIAPRPAQCSAAGPHPLCRWPGFLRLRPPEGPLIWDHFRRLRVLLGMCGTGMPLLRWMPATGLRLSLLNSLQMTGSQVAVSGSQLGSPACLPGQVSRPCPSGSAAGCSSRSYGLSPSADEAAREKCNKAASSAVISSPGVPAASCLIPKDVAFACSMAPQRIHQQLYCMVRASARSTWFAGTVGYTLLTSARN